MAPKDLSPLPPTTSPAHETCHRTRRGLLVAFLLSCASVEVLAMPSAQQSPIVPVGTPSGPIAGSNDTQDLLDAIQSLHQLTSNGSPGELLFYGRQYDLYQDVDPVKFTFQDRSNLSIRGQASRLVFHDFDPMENRGGYENKLFDFKDIDGLTVSGLTIAYDREAHSSGLLQFKLVSGGLTGLVLHMDEEYPDLATGFVVQRTQDFDHATGQLKSEDFGIKFNDDDHYATTVYSAPGGGPTIVELWETAQTPQSARTRFANVQPGTGISLSHSKFGTRLFELDQCSNVLFRDIEVEDTSGMVVLGRNCTNLTFDNLDIIDTYATSSRVLSATADGVHLAYCNGDIVMRNCEMARQGDDALNIHEKYITVQEVMVNPTSVDVSFVVDRNYFSADWQVGDVIEFSLPDLTPTSQATVTGGVTYSPDPADPDTMTASFASLPGVAAGFRATNVTNLPTSVLVEDCMFSDNIAHGVVIKADNTMVRNCIFRRNSLAAVSIHADGSQFHESNGPESVVIKNCTIDGSNRYGANDLGAIEVKGTWKDASGNLLISPAGTVKSVTIRDCIFENLIEEPGFQKAAIYIGSTDGATIASNVFDNVDNGLHALLYLVNGTGAMSNGVNCPNAYSGGRSSCSTTRRSATRPFPDPNSGCF